MSSPVTAAELRAMFPHWSHAVLYDATYARVTNDWLFNKFALWFWKKSSKYTRKHDCDNFARKFCTEAQDAHAESTNTAEAAAVGEFLYTSTQLGRHAIVVALTEDPLPVFLEPQTGQRLHLTPQEISSCSDFIF
jgi:hypothetical protein